MKVSIEHGTIERSLKRHWRKDLKSDPTARKKSRKKREGRSSWLSGLNGIRLTRLIIWGSAFAPFPNSWMYCVAFASLGGLIRATVWNSRGYEEKIVDLYGADDTGILNLSHRWVFSVMLWSALDAIIYLGIWWLTLKIPFWAFCAGVPLYVLGSTASIFLLAFIIPPKILSFIAGWSYVLIWAPYIFHTNKGLSENTINSVTEFLGVLTPSGWAILMLRGLLGGDSGLLWIAVPLLAAAVTAAWFIVRSQSQRFLERNETAGAEIFKVSSLEEDSGEISKNTPTVQAVEESLESIFNGLRQRDLLDYPYKNPQKAKPTTVAAWTVGIVFCIALMARYQFFFSQEACYTILGCALMIMHVLWIPFVASPAWFYTVFLSQNRTASIFTLFPVPLRSLLRVQIKGDLRRIGKTALPLFALSAVALAIALPSNLVAAIALAFLTTSFFLLNLPMAWFNLAMRPLSNKPFGKANVFRGFLVTFMALIFITEIFTAIFFIFVAFSSRPLELAGWSLLVLVPGFVNVVLAMSGIWLGLSTYERMKCDVIKPPPRK